MHRRTFHRNLLAGLLSWPLFGFRQKAERSPDLLRPKRLQPGDTIGLITPGSYLSDEGLGRAVRNLESLGFRVKLGEHISAENGFVAGTDEQRLADLHAMFADREVAGIWCARGGYGCTRLLPFIDYDLIRDHPKALIGYSDITALHVAIHQRTGLVTFHGPVGASELTDYTRDQFEAVLMEGRAPYTIELSEDNLAKEADAYQPMVLNPGKARGVLTGGNLSLLAALCGTPDEPNFAGKLVFMEEIGEKPYRIDRMLTQLRQAAGIGAAAGIALGIFAGCEAGPDDRSLTLLETLQDRLGDLGIPVVYGLSFGHIEHMCTLPVGLPAELDTGTLTLTLEEAGVV